MSNLYTAWGTSLLLGIVLLAIDVVFLPLFEVKGIPTLSIIGAALILLTFTSVLNWIFKTAWDDRDKANRHQSKDNPTQ